MYSSIIRRATLVIVCTLIVTACKIRVDVPPGGYVETLSGSFICHSGQTCDVEVTDIFFDETFIAVPEEGMYFNGWEKRDRGLFGGSNDPARIETSAAERNDAIMSFLHSDEVFFLSPTFSSECTTNCQEPLVTLYENSIFSFEPRKLPWPYSSSGNVSANVIGSNTTDLASFKLTAEGSDFTIFGVQAYDENSLVDAFIDGLSEGQIIRDGEEVEFSLASQLTGGNTARLVYRFEILETGDRFEARYSFQSN